MALKQGGYPFFRTVLGSPRHIVAPMVDQSELAWRILSRRYGADLCFTPMINSSVFVRSEHYREAVFSTCEGDRPLVVQLCGNDPAIVLQAAQMLAPHCDAVDLNLGCPQNIARRGRYGAFLQDEWETVGAIVKTLHEQLSVPVTCKIRVFEDRVRSVDYAKMLQSNGCQMLTVHGRTREQKGQFTGLACWDTIKAIKAALNIPVIANGNILYKSDIDACIEATGVDGVMTSETHLCNPAVFQGLFPHICDLSEEYIALAIEHKHTRTCVRAHLFRMWHRCIQGRDHIRNMLALAKSIDEMLEACKVLRCELDELAAAHPELDAVKSEADLPGRVASCSPEFVALQVAPWRAQPRVRNMSKDADDVEASREKVREAKRKLAGISPEEQREKDMNNQAAILKRKEARYTRCEGCKANPMSAKCDHARCRSCCKPHCATNILDCSGHKMVFHTKRAKREAVASVAEEKPATAVAVAASDSDAQTATQHGHAAPSSDDRAPTAPAKPATTEDSAAAVADRF